MRARLILLALVVVLGSGSEPASAKRATNEYRLRVRQILLQMQKEANERTALVMEDISTWMGRYCRDNEHFPSDDLEREWVSNRLSRLMPKNPFLATSATDEESHSRQPVRDEERMKLVVQLDRRLDLEGLKSAQETPPDAWQAPAGTITVISDGYHLAAIWAAGADQRPIRDTQTGRVRVIIARCGR